LLYRLKSPETIPANQEEPMLANDTPPPARPSPLMLSDHLLTLAEEAARAGLKRPAGTLLRLALRVLEDAPPAPPKA
jgi:hypothetical protein